MRKNSLLIPLAVLFLTACRNDPPEDQQKNNQQPGVDQAGEPYCLNSKTLSNPAADGSIKYEPCSGLCTFGTCENSGEYNLPATCKLSDAPYCFGDTIAISCMQAVTEENSKNTQVVVTHCQDGRVCKDGFCLPRDEKVACLADYCKDLHTLVTCKAGQESIEACKKNELCLANACVETSGITTCNDKNDCNSDELCRDGLCYLESNFAIKKGAPCDAGTFQEYCEGNIEVWCGYDGIVEYNDCAQYNGCAMLVQKIFRSGLSIRNAICRGESAYLEQCPKAGAVSKHCLNAVYEDMPFLNFSYSLTDFCEIASDGTMVARPERIETDCGQNSCDEERGVCAEK